VRVCGVWVCVWCFVCVCGCVCGVCVGIESGDLRKVAATFRMTSQVKFVFQVTERILMSNNDHH
jgi:hypothetical protein